MKNWSYSQVEKTVITEAIILLCAWAHCISDVAHSVLMVPLCGANFFIGKQRKCREVKHFSKVTQPISGGI